MCFYLCTYKGVAASVKYQPLVLGFRKLNVICRPHFYGMGTCTDQSLDLSFLLSCLISLRVYCVVSLLETNRLPGIGFSEVLGFVN